MVRRRSDFPPHCRRCRSNDHRFVQKTVPGQRDARSGRTPGPRRRRCLHNAGLVLVGRWVFSPGQAPSPQNVSADVRYMWSSWSDGGGATHLVTANTALTLVATFVEEVAMRISTSPV